MEGTVKVVVTAHPILAALIHGARFLVCDNTFKQTNGELNEWEVAIWHGALNERETRISFHNLDAYEPMSGVTVARVYSNGATKETFGYIWEGFFNAVKTITGKGIKFKVFDDSGTIQCVILDMEAAQVQGLGVAITQMKMNDPSSSQITEVDPDILVQYLIKLCYVHWDRQVHILFSIMVVLCLTHYAYIEAQKSLLASLAVTWSSISTNFGLLIILSILQHGRSFVRNTQAKIYEVSELPLHRNWEDLEYSIF